MKRTSLSTVVAVVVVTLLTARPLLSRESSSVPASMPATSSGELKTVLAVSFSGLDHAMSDLDFIAQLADNPFLPVMAVGGLQEMFGEETLAAIDGERPWGFVVRTDGEQFPMFAFLPITCPQQFLTAVKSKLGRPEETDEGPLEFFIQGQPVYLEFANGWALFSNTPGALSDVPDDPTQLLEGIVDSYDLGGRIVVKNIPKLYRALAVGGVRMGFEPFMRRAPGESGEQYSLRVGMAQQAVDNVKTLLNELDTVELGLAIDQESSSARLEYKVTAVEGTRTAQRLAAGAGLRTQFAGFAASDSALTLGVSTEIAESQAAQLLDATEMIRSLAVGGMQDQLLSPPERRRAKTRLIGLMDVLDGLIQGRRIDAAAGLSLKSDALTLLAGLHLPDSRKLESLVRSLAEQLIEAKEGDAITLDADELDDVRFHLIALPLDLDDMPAATPKLRVLVGDSLDVVLAFGDDTAYLALGRDAIGSLKRAIKDSRAEEDTAVPRVRLSIAAGPIAQFTAQMGAGPVEQIAVASTIAAMLRETPGTDHLIVTSNGLPSGQEVRIEIEQGLLKVLGSIPQLMIDSAGIKRTVGSGQ